MRSDKSFWWFFKVKTCKCSQCGATGMCFALSPFISWRYPSQRGKEWMHQRKEIIMTGKQTNFCKQNDLFVNNNSSLPFHSGWMEVFALFGYSITEMPQPCIFLGSRTLYAIYCTCILPLLLEPSRTILSLPTVPQLPVAVWLQQHRNHCRLQKYPNKLDRYIHRSFCSEDVHITQSSQYQDRQLELIYVLKYSV